MIPRVAFHLVVLGPALLSLGGCASDSAAPVAPPALHTDAIKFWENTATLYWSGVARELAQTYKVGQQPGTRGLTYLSLAQYNAVIAAEQGNTGSVHPSEHAAVGGASVAVLSWLYPAEAAELELRLAANEAGDQWPGENHTDDAAGEAIGRDVGSRVVASAATDRFNLPFTGTIPVGPGFWYSAAVPPQPPIAPRLGEMRPFFMTSGSEFRPPPPPAFGSPDFLAALAEVRHFSDTRTSEQDAIAKFWAAPQGLILITSYYQIVAADLITRFHLNEREAAHTLALMNMAAMDAFIACHDGKYTYWLIRPPEADPNIVTAIPLPNHPSYPANHGCVTTGALSVLAALFPSEATNLNAMADEAAISRVYGGIHYRFDIEAGQTIGRRAAALALAKDVHGHEPFPIP
ncbi:MAG TPA: vanadium-dependent haloperoxidase [Gemmatimonadaceae bacterium]|nr:vanadium-dependent haloperoxidase [Gemmatimonadaceae bacterium]